jgi:hypothetical protein
MRWSSSQLMFALEFDLISYGSKPGILIDTVSLRLPSTIECIDGMVYLDIRLVSTPLERSESYY